MKRGQVVARECPGRARDLCYDDHPLEGLVVDVHADKVQISVRVPTPVPRPPMAPGPREQLVRWRRDEVEVIR